MIAVAVAVLDSHGSMSVAGSAALRTEKPCPFYARGRRYDPRAMNWHYIPRLLAVLVLAFVVGCGSDDGDGESAGGGSAGSDPSAKESIAEEPTTQEPESDEPPAQSALAEVAIGDTVPITGSGLSLKLTATELKDPLSGPQSLAPSGNARLVGVEIEFQNVGQTAYQPNLFGGSATTTDNRQIDSIPPRLAGECGEGLPSTVQPGEKLIGCIPFEVPEGAQIETFQYEPAPGPPIIWANE